MNRQRFINITKTEFEFKLDWSCNQGNIKTTHNKLKNALGKFRKGNEKTSVEYFIMLEDGTIFMVYDYKYYGKESAYRDPNGEKEFSIGAKDKISGMKAIVFLDEILKEKEDETRI
jgi:hypothetical protein